MTLNKNLHPWAEDGVRESDETFTDEKRDIGWVGGDRPYRERFNRLQFETDNKLNKLVDESPPTYSTISTVSIINQTLSTGRWATPWGMTHDGINLFGGPGSEAYIDTCVYFDSDDNPRVLALDQTSNVIHDFDPRASNPGLEPTGTPSGTLTDDLGGGTWVATSMATDGVSVFVTFRNTAASPDQYYIQAWDIDTWTVKTYWPAAGRALPATGNPLNADTRPCTVIVASASRLAVVQSATVISANTDPAISILLLSSGSITDSGAGDAPTGVSGQPCGTLCSDGLNIYFGVAHPTLNTYVCTATIADPDVGVGGGAGYPLVHTGSYKVYLVSCGLDLVVSTYFDATAPADTDVVIRTHHYNTAALDEIVRGQNSHSTPLDADNYLLHSPRAICFDGLNVWIYGGNHIADALYTTHTAVLVKIDVGKFCQDLVVQNRQLPDIVSGTFMLNGRATKAWGDDHAYSSILFDGRDIFSVFDTTTGQTYSGYIFRLPRAVLRH